MSKSERMLNETRPNHFPIAMYVRRGTYIQPTPFTHRPFQGASLITSRAMKEYSLSIVRAITLSLSLVNVAWSQSLIGYVVVTESPVSSVWCNGQRADGSTTNFRTDWQGTLMTIGDERYALCDMSGDTNLQMGISCEGQNVAVNVFSLASEDHTSDFTQRCEENYSCMTATLWDEWETQGDSWLIVSCRDSLGLGKGVSTIYARSPTDFTETGPVTTSAEESETASTTDSPHPTVASTAANTSNGEEGSGDSTNSTKSDGNDNVSDSESQGDDDSLSGGAIAGIVIGSIAAVALIICALLLGIRMGKKLADRRDDEAPPPSGFRTTMRSLPRPKISWSRPESSQVPSDTPYIKDRGTVSSVVDAPASVESLRITQSIPVAGVTTEPKSVAGTPSPRPTTNHQDLELPPTLAEARESIASELPTRFESRDWAGTQPQQFPYEMDTQQPYPRTGPS
ncbi:hypothetical protein B0T10DRAFT_554113 [Thelonectria olida]|uniref:Uncharacterized protein n=1 Tax=Thelonectria olida TaxID=1576542 RepID=A0A9P8VMX1_9HYPO|nr:hypothetical protein B0T10DRAFT_554113 [Thelonectria olida]